MSDNSIPRYCPQRPLPPYSYVPGLTPHPTSDERGHSFGQHAAPPAALTESSYRGNEEYLYAIDLLNHGFYWEAHEAWESLWHVAGRSGPAADFLKGLIKLAAAGVKVREGRVAGVRQHAERAGELFRGVKNWAIDRNGLVFGLRLQDLGVAAAKTMGSASDFTERDGSDANRRLTIALRLVDG